MVASRIAPHREKLHHLYLHPTKSIRIFEERRRAVGSSSGSYSEGRGFESHRRHKQLLLMNIIRITYKTFKAHGIDPMGEVCM